jgi:hypothetical protein
MSTNSRATLELAAALLLLAAGCSAPADPHENAAFPLEAITESGELEVVMRGESGAKPVRGTNTLHLEVTRVATGDPADGLSFSLVPFMPSMGHGSPSEPRVESEGAGSYRASDVVLPMPGLWELRTTITAPSADYVLFKVDVD